MTRPPDLYSLAAQLLRVSPLWWYWGGAEANIIHGT